MRLELEVIPEYVINLMYIFHINVFYHPSSKNTGLKYMRRVLGGKVAGCLSFETNRSKFMSTMQNTFLDLQDQYFSLKNGD